MDLTDSLEAMELASPAPMSRFLGSETWEFERALESSTAERLQDLARNSMGSTGVSGAAQNSDLLQLAGPFSSMFSSLCTVLLALHELTITTSSQQKQLFSFYYFGK